MLMQGMGLMWGGAAVLVLNHQGATEVAVLPAPVDYQLGVHHGHRQFSRWLRPRDAVAQPAGQVSQVNLP